jgi:transcriptional regulator with XRE-family HTH domain
MSTQARAHLSDLRTKAGLTQRAVAAALGLSPGNYNEIESGKRNLPAHHIGKLAELFGTTPRQIVEFAGSKRLEKLLGTFANDANANDAAFNVAITGRRFIPRYEAGEFAVVDSSQFPVEGADCAVRDKQGRYYIKRFLSQTDTHYLLLEQFSPRRQIKVPKSAIDGIFAVTGRTAK